MKIVGISICSTGIAHTYMAAEALVSVAKQRGHEIKIETQGAMGFENEVDMDDVESADVVLLATGCVAEGLDRFEGTPIVEVDVADAIKNPLAAILKCEEIIK